MDCVHEDAIYSLRANSIYIAKCPLNGGKPGTAILINRFRMNSPDCSLVSVSTDLSTYPKLMSAYHQATAILKTAFLTGADSATRTPGMWASSGMTAQNQPGRMRKTSPEVAPS